MTQMPADGDNLRERLSRALPAAMKARDRPAVNALRSAMAAIDNAGAVDPTQARPDTAHPGPPAANAIDPEPGRAEGGDPNVAGSVVGVGVTEVERRSLSEAIGTIGRFTAAEVDARVSELLREVGLPEHYAPVFANSAYATSQGALYDDSGTLGRLIGRPTTPIAETIRQALQG